jgi:hypothetical protein
MFYLSEKQSCPSSSIQKGHKGKSIPKRGRRDQIGKIESSQTSCCQDQYPSSSQKSDNFSSTSGGIARKSFGFLLHRHG